LFNVYKVINLLNRRYYYGVHETNNPNDNYLGSGIAIKRAVRKYGKHNFKKDILFTFKVSAEAYTKEVELLRNARQAPLCYNLHEGGKGGFKYINEQGLSDPRKAGRIAKEKGNTGRPRGSKNHFISILPDSHLLCRYGCGLAAAFLIGNKENPCCSSHHGACPAYCQCKKKMISKPIDDSSKLCSYGCGTNAKFLLGKYERPCCSNTFCECPSHWKNLRTFSDAEIKRKTKYTLLARYGVSNPMLSSTLLSKRDTTNLERYGGRSPMCDPKVGKKQAKAQSHPRKKHIEINSHLSVP